jgi:hypothetical protein
MTMEEVASEENLRMAFQQVASNKGAPGPDRQSVVEVREHLDELLPALHGELLNGNYQPGNIRRVWIPKAGGGQRGLGIPNVIDPGGFSATRLASREPSVTPRSSNAGSSRLSWSGGATKTSKSSPRHSSRSRLDDCGRKSMSNYTPPKPTGS